MLTPICHTGPRCFWLLQKQSFVNIDNNVDIVLFADDLTLLAGNVVDLQIFF